MPSKTQVSPIILSTAFRLVPDQSWGSFTILSFPFAPCKPSKRNDQAAEGQNQKIRRCSLEEKIVGDEDQEEDREQWSQDLTLTEGYRLQSPFLSLAGDPVQELRCRF